MKKLLPIALCAVLVGCGETRVVDLDSPAEVAEMQNVMELEYRDWTKTAENMTKSMLSSGAFYEIKNPVVAMGEIKNDTMQRFDTDILMQKIRKTIINSGRAKISAASGTVTPNVVMSGKMLQRNLKLKSGWFSSVDTRVEYYLQLTLSDAKTGLALWEDEQPIVKEGDHAPTW